MSKTILTIGFVLSSISGYFWGYKAAPRGFIGCDNGNVVMRNITIDGTPYARVGLGINGAKGLVTLDDEQCRPPLEPSEIAP